MCDLILKLVKNTIVNVKVTILSNQITWGRDDKYWIGGSSSFHVLVSQSVLLFNLNVVITSDFVNCKVPSQTIKFEPCLALELPPFKVCLTFR